MGIGISRILLALCALMLSTSAGLAQEVSIQARLDRAEMRTGEQAAIDVTIRTDDLPNTKFYLAEDVRAGEPFVVLEFAPLDTIELDDRLREISARMVITSFDSTLITIPPIIVETPTGRAETSPMALNIVQPEVDAAHPEQFRDIKAPWEISLRLRDILELIFTSYLFWGVLLLLVAGYSYYRYRRLPRTVAALPSEPAPISVEPTAYEGALAALDALRGTRLTDEESYRAFYTELISVLKRYMDAAQGWTTQEMTSSEVLALLRRDLLHRPLRTMLQELLTEADMIKFARHRSSEDIAQQALTLALRFVREANELWEHLSPEVGESKQI